MAKGTSGKGSSGKGSGGTPRVYTGPNKDGSGWVNKTNGEVTSNHRRKDTAVKRGREDAIELGGEHTIAKKDGTIGEKNSYGNDPNPPKDKR